MSADIFQSHAHLMLEALCRENGWSLARAKQEVIDELHLRRYRRLVQADREQAQLCRDHGERRVVKVDGEDLYIAHQIHPVVYFDWIAKLGPDCWKCPTFVREFLAKNPHCRIKNVRAAHAVAGISFDSAGAVTP